MPVARYIDGPAAGRVAHLTYGQQTVDLEVQGSCHSYRYYVRLAGVRHWPFIRAAWFLTCSQKQPSHEALLDIVSDAYWEMDVQPSILYAFPMWWEWVRAKLWFEEEFVGGDLEYDYHRFKLRNNIP